MTQPTTYSNNVDSGTLRPIKRKNNRYSKHELKLMCSQINLRHSIAATRELEMRMPKLDCVMVTEPWIYKSKIKGLDNVNVFYKGQRPRAAVIANKAVKAQLLDKYSNDDIACITISTVAGQIVLVSYYWDINMNSLNESLTQVTEYCKLNSIPMLISMDSNAHGQLWGCEENNQRGTTLEEWSISNDLQCLNEGQVDTFVTSRASSIIDVTFANEWLDVTDWRVDKSQSLSDHRYINYSIDTSNHRTYVTKREFKRVDWTAFKESLVEYIGDTLDREPRFNGIEDIEAWTSWLIEGIWSELRHQCPKKRMAERSKNKWWNRACAAARHKVKLLLNEWCRDRENPVLQDKLRSAKSDYKKEIFNAKENSWKNFVESIETVQETGRIARALRGEKRNLGAIAKEGEIASPKSTINVLMTTHFPECRKTWKLPGGKGYHRSRRRLPDNLIQFNGDEVKKALMTFKDNKAIGADGIPPRALKELPDKFYYLIARIYDNCLKFSYTPLEWRAMKVVFIPKPGKDDYSIPKSYRPITLASYLVKGLEKVVKYHIQSKIEKKLVNQFAFTKGKSVDTAISKVIDELEYAQLNSRIGAAVMLDIEGAFDRVPFKTIRKSMKRAKLPREVIEWFDHLVRNRLVTTELYGEKIWRVPGRGTPQGGVLSPLIWNIVVHYLLTKFRKGPVKATGFADDLCLTAQSIDPNTLADIMQEAIDKVLAWGHRVGLNFNPNKTEYLVVTRKRKTIVPCLRVNGVVIKPSETVNYLGITIDNRLNWRANMKNKRRKAVKAVNALKPLIRKNWGLRPNRVIWAIESIISPMVTHGALVWGRPDKVGALRIMCEHLYRPLLLGIGGIFKTTPTMGMLALLNIKPLDIQASCLALKARLRTKEHIPSHWDGLGKLGIGHHKALDKILDTLISKGDIDRWGLERWEALWSENKYRQTKEIIPKISYNSNLQLRGFSRSNLRCIMGFFTGHFIFQKHLHQMNLVDSEECRFCMEEDEDAHHLLFDCPALEYLRTDHQTLEDHDLTTATKTSYEKYTPEWYRSLTDLSVKLGAILLRDEDRTGEE